MVQAPDIEMGHQDLPQALVLLSEMNVSAQHVAGLVDNMLVKVRKGEISTDQGLSFLEMKYNMLLGYLINLTFVVLRKCSGESIDGDPCIDRLVEIRTVLEKIRPIDHKLKYQIDKLVKTAVSGVNANDPLMYRANPDNMIRQSNEDSADDSEDESTKVKNSGVYVPPKISAVHYTGEESLQERNKRMQERSKKAALSSAIMEELRDEYLDMPTEIQQGNRAQQKISKAAQERQRYEEEYLTRLPIDKKEKHSRGQLTTLGQLGDEITDFGAAGGKNTRKRPGKSKTPQRNKRKRFH